MPSLYENYLNQDEVHCEPFNLALSRQRSHNRTESNIFTVPTATER